MLHAIARLVDPDSAVDLYTSDITDSAQLTAAWPHTLTLGPDVLADLDGLDRMLDAAGYQRVRFWRARLTSGAALRYFTQVIRRPGYPVTACR